ncbi:MAG: glucoamylase family protein [Armatimonadota bacterium]
MLATCIVFAATVCLTSADAAQIRRGTDLLDAIQRSAFRFFRDHADSRTGLVRDRAHNFGEERRTVASTAATGFALASMPVGVERRWIPRAQAASYCNRTLTYLLHQAPNEHGFFYHFVDMRTGRRVWQCEVSSIDTALVLGGALTAGAYFGGQTQALASELLRRADFGWMLTDGGSLQNSLALCHGWTPEGGFLPHRWDAYAEQSLLYLLAMGSPTHPVPPQCWDAIRRPVGEYAGLRTFAAGPLFIHQYSHAFVDFRRRVDRLGFDYWRASVNATLANRRFCMDQASQFLGYGPNCWGLSASDCVEGYHVHGAPPGWAGHDGTVAPHAALASMPFAPKYCQAVAEHLRSAYGDKLWGRYGFSSAFNLRRSWWSKDVLGIDLGCTLLMIENYRTALIWRLCSRVHALSRGMQMAGFRTVSKR